MFVPGAPIVSIEPMTANFTDGSSLNLSCSARSHPSSSYEWHRSGVPLQQTNKNWHDGAGTLYLRDLQSSESGTYVCVATNTVGQGRAAVKINYIGMARRVTQ